MRANTDWFRDAKWGIFFTYLADVAGTQEQTELQVEEWNAQIDNFDVEGLAAQLEAIGAGYFYITLGQNSGYYLSPNATYDSLVGRSPSRGSRRDLVADLIKVLTPRGIRTMVYSTAVAPALDRQAIESLRCTPLFDPTHLGYKADFYTQQPGVDERLTDFQRSWEAIIREWSLRWGKGVHGWWFDGCYSPDKMYLHPDEPNFASFSAAAKAGNPDSLVAFNRGISLDIICQSEYEDYTAGEADKAFPVHTTRPWEPNYGRFVDGAQFHILSYLGEWWGQGQPRFCDEFALGMTKEIIRHEGVITWDVPPTKDGHIAEPFMEQLAKLRDATR